MLKRRCVYLIMPCGIIHHGGLQQRPDKNRTHPTDETTPSKPSKRPVQQLRENLANELLPSNSTMRPKVPYNNDPIPRRFHYQRRQPLGTSASNQKPQSSNHQQQQQHLQPTHSTPNPLIPPSSLNSQVNCCSYWCN